MQTEQPMEARVHVPFFTAEDIAKKRLRRYKDEVPNETIAQALDTWVRYKGWTGPMSEDVLVGTGLTPFSLSQLVYRYGYQKRLLPPEQWVPGWGRRPRKAKQEPEATTPQPASPQWSYTALTERFRRLDERINVLGRLPLVEDWLTDQDLMEKLKYLLTRVDIYDGIVADFTRHEKVATPSLQLSGKVTSMDQEIMRLAGIIEHEKVGSTSLYERLVKIENKLRGGGRKPISRLTKFRRHLVHRVLYLFRGR